MTTALTVLYAEDDENDVLFMQRAFGQAGLPISLQVAINGKEAVDYLAGNGRFADRETYPLPNLVLLDLNMPLLSGFEALEWIRQQPQFQSLPVVIFTASDQERDKEKSRRLGASEYIVKPGDLSRLAGLAKDIVARWLRSS